MFARYLLRFYKQQPGQTVDQYFQNVRTLSTDCNFRKVKAVIHREEAIRDAFIGGLASFAIRRSLLEETDLELQR